MKIGKDLPSRGTGNGYPLKMLLETAFSLQGFINSNSTGLQATLMNVGEKAWVIVAEKDPAGSRLPYVEPLVDPCDYRLRASKGGLRFGEEVCRLLGQWEAVNFQ